MNEKVNTRILSLFFAALVVVFAGGCVAVAAGGAAAGAATAVDRRTTGTVIEDQTIELKAASALRADEAVRTQTHLNVISYNTNVLLTGEAPSEELRARVVEIVRGVEKVKKVYNEVTIAAPSSYMTRSSDTVITSKVKTKLLAREDIEGVNIKVVTENGVVYLMGLVSRAEADSAASVASETGGVQKVVKVFEFTD